MPDVFSKAKRSQVMSRIRSHGNKDTELLLARLMRAEGITGWRRHLRLRASTAAGREIIRVRPDFVFRAQRVAVFVDGCFWHGCPRHCRMPGGNAAYWRKKIRGNQARDARVTRALRRAGWKVLRIWECALSRQRSAATLTRLRKSLCGGPALALSQRMK
jgi:DNA mismatch endonuclease (patch repair protein)